MNVYSACGHSPSRGGAGEEATPWKWMWCLLAPSSLVAWILHKPQDCDLPSSVLGYLPDNGPKEKAGKCVCPKNAPFRETSFCTAVSEKATPGTSQIMRLFIKVWPRLSQHRSETTIAHPKLGQGQRGEDRSLFNSLTEMSYQALCPELRGRNRKAMFRIHVQGPVLSKKWKKAALCLSFLCPKPVALPGF